MSRRSPSTSHADDASSDSGGINRVVTIARVRPFARRELNIQAEVNAGIHNDWEKIPLRSVVEMEGGDSVFLDHNNHYAERQRFPFDYSFWSIPSEQQSSGNPFADNEDVYLQIGIPIIKNIWDGYNSCCFAYGQTGSGKTWSQMGIPENPGLIPRVCQGLFDTIEKKRKEEKEKEAHLLNATTVSPTTASSPASTASSPSSTKSSSPDGGTMFKEYRLEARFFEIYNEKVKDLLWAIRTPSPEDANIDHENIRVRHMGSEINLVGLTNVDVASADDCLRLIDEGTKNRSVGATKMNDQSSRSHSIFKLTFIQTTRVLPKDKFDKPKVFHRTSAVSLVDLAGSERMKKTGAEGQRLKEAVAINQSLTTLKNVIDALVEQRSVIPYRDSTLTWILSDNLGGNSKTFMIACVSPHFDNADETLNTLRYALRAQSIVCHATVNESDELKKMNKMRDELEKLQRDYVEGTGDSEFMQLKSRQEELTASTSKAKEAGEEAIKEEQRSRGELERLRKQRYNVCYRAAFHRVFQKRADLAYTGFFARDGAVLAGLQREVNTYHHDDTVSDKELSDLRAEERRTLSALRNSEAELLRQRERFENIQESLRDLDKMEVRNSDSIIQRNARIPSAAHVNKNMIQRKLLMISIERDREVRKNATESDKLKDGYKQEIDQLRSDRANKLEPLTQSEEQVRDTMKKEEAFHKKNMAELKAKLQQLQSSCVFVENENKRAATEIDEQILVGNKARFEVFAATETAGKKRLYEYQVQSKASLAQELENMRLELSDGQHLHDTQIDRLLEKSRDEVSRINRIGETEIKKTLEDCKSRLHRFQALNKDCQACLLRSKAAQKRYSDIHSLILQVLRGEAPPEMTTTDDMDSVENLIRRLQQSLELAEIKPGDDISTLRVQHASMTPLAFRTNASPNRGGSMQPGTTSVTSRSSSKTPSHSSSRVGGYPPSPGAGGSQATPRTPGRNVSTPRQNIGRSASQFSSVSGKALSNLGEAAAVAGGGGNVLSVTSSTTPSPRVLTRKAPPVYQTATSKLRSQYAAYDRAASQQYYDMMQQEMAIKQESARNLRSARGQSPTTTNNNNNNNNQQGGESKDDKEPWNRTENYFGYKSINNNEEVIPASSRVNIEGSVIAMRTHSLPHQKRGKSPSPTSPPRNY